ncbi:hypothetical protein ILYODFUR_023800 [Ilyodon furcidens]|uniref:Uncharacterized protein n=1 Tax=Ilyodon furcidens TaxID=33524 RepID=A0ABV0UC13_9TELE
MAVDELWSTLCCTIVLILPHECFLSIHGWFKVLPKYLSPDLKDCSTLDVVLGSFVTSWMSHGCPLNFGKQPHLGRFIIVTCFNQFVDNCPHDGSLESQILGNGNVSRLIDVNDFVSHLLLNFFNFGHDVLLFETFWSTS